MSFSTSMQERYTTKVYDKTQKVSPEKVEELKQILRFCPSSINSQPWHFTFVIDKQTKEKLSQVSWHNGDRIKNCDQVVVFGVPNNINDFETRIEKELPEGAYNYYKEFLKPLPEAEIKAWFGRQVYLALGVFLAACANMEIDATPMEGIEPEQYDGILEQTEYRTLVAVCIGKRDTDDFNQPSKKAKSRRPISDVIKTI